MTRAKPHAKQQAKPQHAKQSYHHGNLKQALLDAAEQALEKESLEKLSLRGLASTLGVTPTAVYGHFADKTALLVDLRTIGFKQLSHYLQQATDAAPAGDPEAKVRALGHAYMAFAREHPNMFDALFGWTPPMERITADCVEAGAGGEGLLRNALIEMMRAQGCDMDDYQACTASFSAWSLVHGISMLLKTGSVDGAVYCEKWPSAFSSEEPEQQARIVDHLLTIQIAGLKATLEGLC